MIQMSPDSGSPVQPLKINYIGFYGTDAGELADNFTLTFGLRTDIPYFEY